MINYFKKSKFYVVTKAGILLTLVTLSLNAQDVPAVPNPARLVNDYVGVLSASEIQSLESKLVEFDDTTSNQIAVIIVKSVEPYDMNSYATKLGRAWGIGHEGKNNGVVVVWATEDRKVYVSPGYGLEGALPDAYAKRIVDRVIIPYFKQDRYFEGLDAGTSAIMDYATGEYEAEPDSGEGELPFWAFFLMMVVIVIVIRIFSKGGRGGGGGLMAGDSSRPYTTYTGWGGHSGNWSGGSGGFGGGGFGDFGGGSFGGGGAGGSY
jgi:uncharacterized protein